MDNWYAYGCTCCVHFLLNRIPNTYWNVTQNCHRFSIHFTIHRFQLSKGSSFMCTHSRGICISHDNKYSSNVWIWYPHFWAIYNIITSFFICNCLQRKCICSSIRFWQAETSSLWLRNYQVGMQHHLDFDSVHYLVFQEQKNHKEAGCVSTTMWKDEAAWVQIGVVELFWTSGTFFQLKMETGPLSKVLCCFWNSDNR